VNGRPVYVLYGFALAALRVKSGGLVAPMLAHAVLLLMRSG